MRKKKLKGKELRKGWKILFKYFKRHKMSVFVLTFLGIVSAVLSGILPRIFGFFVDALIDFSGTVSIGKITIAAWIGFFLLWVAIQVVSEVVSWVSGRRDTLLSAVINRDYQVQAFSYLLLLPLNFYKDNRAGMLQGHILQATGGVNSVISGVFTQIGPHVLKCAIAVIILFSIKPLFILILVVGISGLLLILAKTMPIGIKINTKVHSEEKNAQADALESIINIESVKYMVTERHEKHTFTKYFRRAEKITKKMGFFWSNLHFSRTVILLAMSAAIIFLSAHFIQQGQMTVGELVALSGYIHLVFDPLYLFSYIWQDIQNSLVVIKQAEDAIFSAKQEDYRPENAYIPSAINGAVEFRNVFFAYDRKKPVLEGLSFTVEPGECVALVGKSGAGKTTAANLIPAHYFPQKGRVLVDGHDTRAFDLTALRNSIAIVPQEPVLFNDTFMMNIRYANLKATDEEVIEAAKKARVHEFIQELPKKYNHKVGERGGKISVGQKQRIAIARAMLRNPSILILDEPTSALDPETEKQITEAFEELMKGRTTFIIAHRLSTVRKADHIFVLDKGRIVEKGRHEDLKKQEGGLYKRLHDLLTGDGEQPPGK